MLYATDSRASGLVVISINCRKLYAIRTDSVISVDILDFVIARLAGAEWYETGNYVSTLSSAATVSTVLLFVRWFVRTYERSYVRCAALRCAVLSMRFPY